MKKYSYIIIKFKPKSMGWIFAGACLAAIAFWAVLLVGIYMLDAVTRLLGVML